MFYVIDLGGSTIDILEFSDDAGFRQLVSLESDKTDKSNLEDILHKSGMPLRNPQKIILTGGHNRLFADFYQNIPIRKVSEIDAIGAGGSFLSECNDILVCSLGTGTCCVSVRAGHFRHVGGTGIGGGTFLGLCRSLLAEEDFSNLKIMTEKGKTEAVDILVHEIVGGAIGVVPGSATAANFAKAGVQNLREDLAAGIANLVGQTIASIAVFAARAEGHSNIVLGGKMTRIPAIIDIAERTAAIYHRKIIVPEHADFMSAVGAGILSLEES